jgi:hypothetical protein
VRLWDSQTNQCLRLLQGYNSGVWSIAFSPDGQTLVSGGQDRLIRLWDLTRIRRQGAREQEARRQREQVTNLPTCPIPSPGIPVGSGQLPLAPMVKSLLAAAKMAQCACGMFLSLGSQQVAASSGQATVRKNLTQHSNPHPLPLTPRSSPLAPHPLPLPDTLTRSGRLPLARMVKLSLAVAWMVRFASGINHLALVITV